MSNCTPKVIGAPDEIWVNYGELDVDTNHEIIRNSTDSGLTCGEMAENASDVKYVRADIVDELLAALKALVSADYAYLNDRVIGMDGNITRQEVWEARAAISKAEGVNDD